MSAGVHPKTSPRTKDEPRPSASASGGNGSDPAIQPTKSKERSQGRASNGTQPTSCASTPNTNASAAYPLRKLLREFLVDNPHLETRDGIADAYVAHLSNEELRPVLRAAIRRYVYDLVTTDRRRGPVSDAAERPSSNGSATWDAIRVATEDGSLTAYRKIVDAEYFFNSKRTRFGSMALRDIEILMDLRGRQERAIGQQRQRLARTHEQMRATGARSVDDLDPQWLVAEWTNA